MKIKTTKDGCKIFKCPGCRGCHVLRVTGQEHPVWGFNDDHDKPTFTPSIKATGGREGNQAVCHSIVTDGKIAFCGDCTHTLAGQTVDIPEWPYKPGEFGGVVD